MDPATTAGMSSNAATILAGVIQAAATVIAVVWAYRAGRAESAERSKRDVAARIDHLCDDFVAHWDNRRDLDLNRVFNEKHDVRRLWGKRHAAVFQHRAAQIQLALASPIRNQALVLLRLQQLVRLVHAWIDGAPAEGDPSYSIDGVDESRAAADKADEADKAKADKAKADKADEVKAKAD